MQDEHISTKKSLGQHWLRDPKALGSIVAAAQIARNDTVLEIGPGPGTLTSLLVEKARKVVVVEKDEILAAQLPGRVDASNLRVLSADILKFDLSALPNGYKVVANIPYYITGHLLRILSETAHPPSVAVLLVQKEVAQRLQPKAGAMNVISVALQLEYEVTLGRVIPAALFAPAPKVDSQVVVLKKLTKSAFKDLDKKAYMRIVKAGFSSKRKKLRSSLAGGLALSKEQADKLLENAGINGNLRAEDLSLADWYKICLVFDR